MLQSQFSPTVIWVLSGVAIACVLSIIVGLNLTLGTRRKLGHYYVWIGAAVLVCTAAGVILVLANGP